jgi:hypothetical protein
VPYIKQTERQMKDPLIHELSSYINNEGDLNYTITMLCKCFLEKKGECYATHNTILGVLTASQLEWNRRRVAVYEDKKIVENGDV